MREKKLKVRNLINKKGNIYCQLFIKSENKFLEESRNAGKPNKMS